MRDENCIFCKILGGEIPSLTVYEDEEFQIIFDVSPASKGHMLILPKEHVANIYEMEEELVKKAFALAKKTATAAKKVFGCDGVNILQNNGEAAGQTVFHFHIHVIPRYQGDGAKADCHMVSWKQGQQDREALEKAAISLRTLLSDQ